MTAPSSKKECTNSHLSSAQPSKCSSLPTLTVDTSLHLYQKGQCRLEFDLALSRHRPQSICFVWTQTKSVWIILRHIEDIWRFHLEGVRVCDWSLDKLKDLCFGASGTYVSAGNCNPLVVSALWADRHRGMRFKAARYCCSLATYRLRWSCPMLFQELQGLCEA